MSKDIVTEKQALVAIRDEIATLNEILKTWVEMQKPGQALMELQLQMIKEQLSSGIAKPGMIIKSH